jgi:hypothetical protein
MRVVLIILFFLIAPVVRADSLDAAEMKELRRYLAALKDGKPGDAAQVERLAPISLDGLIETMRTYAALKVKIEPHTHRAFQALLERISREALAPWRLVKIYSPEFARFLTLPGIENALGQLLFKQLQTSDTGRLAIDLCVRLTPMQSLEHLANPQAKKKPELFDAWNRRLARGRESRPLPGLDRLLDRIANAYSSELPPEEVEPHLRFLASWPQLRKEYLRWLRHHLEHPRFFLTQKALDVQQRVPALLELNEAVIARCWEAPDLVEKALRNYAYDESTDHSATLRKLWQKLSAERGKARYQCLFAMGVHPKRNDGIALEAIQKESFDLFDVAMPVLRRGDPEKARQAVQHVLTKSERGYEEALRLAHELKLAGFEDEALRIALDTERDQILRQTAMLYLQLAEGKQRRKLLPLLALPKNDLRLSAIRSFASKKGLSPEDLREIGPALVKVALTDPSMGHRQEAMYVLGCWKAPQTMEFFRKLLADNPAVVLSEGYYSDARYWQYRFRLMGLLGMAKLGDKSARTDLLDLHKKGSPAEKMDVLLAFLDLGEAPEISFGDLDSIEPRLVATAAQLIATHGDAAAKERLHKHFASAPLWGEFRGSGVDDYNILRIVGWKEHEKPR